MASKFLSKTLDYLGKKVPFAEDVLPKVVFKTTSSVLDKFERKIGGKEAVKAREDSLYLYSMKIWMILLK